MDGERFRGERMVRAVGFVFFFLFSCDANGGLFSRTGSQTVRSSATERIVSAGPGGQLTVHFPRGGGMFVNHLGARLFNYSTAGEGGLLLLHCQ